MKKLRVTVEGKVYEVLVEVLDEPAGSAPPVAAAVSAPAPVAAPVAVAPAPLPVAPKPAPISAGADDVTSPLAGKLVSVDVKVGDAVEQGAQVATVEAMKMNTYVYAPRSGRVAAVLANVGEPVEEGVALLRLA